MMGFGLFLLIIGMIVCVMGGVAKFWKVFGIGILLTGSGICIGIGSSRSRDFPNGNPEMVMFGWILLIITIVCIIGSIIYTKAKMKAQAQKTYEDTVRANKEIAEAKKKQLSISIFKKCRQKGLSSFDTVEDQNALKIIAGTYGVSDLSKAKKYYKEGKKLVETEELEDQKKRLANKREQEQKKFDVAKEKAHIKGKKKYVSKLETDYMYGIKAMELGKSLEKTVLHNTRYQAKKQDWAIAGGIANGLAGGAAGLATAMEIQRRNAEAEVQAAQIRQQAQEQLIDLNDTMTSLSPAMAEEKFQIDRVNEKLYDESNTYEKFKLLKFSQWSIKVLDSKNVEIKGKVELTQKIELLGSKAVLDGSLKIDVINSSGNIIGSGYYSAPGFDNTNLEEVGFEYAGKISVLCIVDDYMAIKPDDAFECKVSPVSLWIIEC